MGVGEMALTLHMHGSGAPKASSVKSVSISKKREHVCDARGGSAGGR